MKKIINDSNIWDLHIHSCKSPKSSGEFQKLSVKDYIDKILEIFSDYPNLALISFTDHNILSYEVYKEFYSRNTSIKLIPGIEVDVCITGIKPSKHLILYFNVEQTELEEFSQKINALLDGKDNIAINELLEFLISEKVQFLISPHAFKQDKRGIDFDWNDEDTTNENLYKFMDQFFCFWEAAGYSEIAKAVEFLRNFEREDKISIISFSDASDEEKLRNYLDNPPQYFKSLPNFRGIQLAGTDSKRILKKQKNLDLENSGNIIGSIQLKDMKIELSDQLNVIVGGRGSGKSLLLDNMALNMENEIREKNKIQDDRISFLDTIPIALFNFDGSKVEIDSKKIDFYDQSYVAKIFNSKDTTKAIESYFKDEFDSLGELNLATKLQEIKLDFSSNIENITSIKLNNNISNFIGKYRVINENKFSLKFKKTDLKKSKIIEFDVETAIAHSKEKSKLIPKELQDNQNINKALSEFLKVINQEVYLYNNLVEIENLENSIKEKCVNYLETKNSYIKEKNEQEELFINHFKHECRKYEERTNIVNALIRMQNLYRANDTLSTIKDGVDDSKFKFEKKLIYEQPMDYFRKMCVKHLGAKFKDKPLKELYNAFIFKLEDELKSSTTIDKFIDELKNLTDYEITYECNILYGKTVEELENINKMSPGTQTNILMEYIVSKDTKIPLLIDQPEDNIDNETIYTKLTNWFRKLKCKRQVIVVTHDANIVINADAENVIIAAKETGNQFVYQYGALEYNDILNRISIILDGGIEAVERRLKKYGREENNSDNK